ncbi:hypothetical protein HDU91_001162, partial [Kappamyces sp. JEL0680]
MELPVLPLEILETIFKCVIKNCSAIDGTLRRAILLFAALSKHTRKLVRKKALLWNSSAFLHHYYTLHAVPIQNSRLELSTMETVMAQQAQGDEPEEFKLGMCVIIFADGESGVVLQRLGTNGRPGYGEVDGLQ